MQYHLSDAYAGAIIPIRFFPLDASMRKGPCRWVYEERCDAAETMFFEIFIVKNDDILNSPPDTMPRIKGLEGKAFARRQTSQSGLGSRDASVLSRD